MKTFYFLYTLLPHSVKLMKAMLSLAVHFNTNNITVYAHYADIRKISIHTIAQLVRFEHLTIQASACRICGGQTDIWTCHSPGTSGFSC